MPPCRAKEAQSGIRFRNTVPIAADPEILSVVQQALPLGRISTGAELERELTKRTDALAEIAAPGLRVSFVAPGGWRNEFEGLAGYHDGWRDWLETFDSYESEVEAVKTAPGATVLITRQSGTPTGGGMKIENKSAVVIFWADERVARLEFHLDRPMALKAAGL